MKWIFAYLNMSILEILWDLWQMTQSGQCLTWLLNFVVVFVVFKICMLLSYRNFVKFLISKSLSVRSRTGYSLLRQQLWTPHHLHLHLLLWQRLSPRPKVSGVQGGVWCHFHPNGPLKQACCLWFSYPWAVWTLLVRNRIADCHVLPLPSKARPFSGSLGTHAWDLIVFSCLCGYCFSDKSFWVFLDDVFTMNQRVKDLCPKWDLLWNTFWLGFLGSIQVRQ